MKTKHKHKKNLKTKAKTKKRTKHVVNKIILQRIVNKSWTSSIRGRYYDLGNGTGAYDAVGGFVGSNDNYTRPDTSPLDIPLATGFEPVDLTQAYQNTTGSITWNINYFGNSQSLLTTLPGISDAFRIKDGVTSGRLLIVEQTFQAIQSSNNVQPITGPLIDGGSGCIGYDATEIMLHTTTYTMKFHS